MATRRKPEPPVVGSDINGTLLNHGGRSIVVNRGLVELMSRRSVRKLCLISNEPGLAMHLKTGDPRFPSPEMFMLRLLLLMGELRKWKIEVSAVYVALWHPAITNDDLLVCAANRIDALTVVPRFFFGADILASGLPAWRKPQPTMLSMAGVEVYYGDSLEDEQAAVGVKFYKVERFDSYDTGANNEPRH